MPILLRGLLSQPHVLEGATFVPEANSLLSEGIHIQISDGELCFSRFSQGDPIIFLDNLFIELFLALQKVLSFNNTLLFCCLGSYYSGV